MQVLYLSAADIKKKLGVLVINTFAGAVIDGFEKCQGNQISGEYAQIGINNGIANGNIQFLPGSECKQVRSHIFWVKYLPVLRPITACIPIATGAVHDL